MLRRLGNLSSKRSLTSYSVVQSLVARGIRNRRFQTMTDRVRSLKYLDIGCGPNMHPHVINMDYLWRPGVDICWDVTRGLPFEQHSLRGIFTEHCLEYFPLPVAEALLRDCRRVLAPGSIIRIVLPDAALYLGAYARRAAGEAAAFPYQEVDYRGLRSPILDVNRIFYEDLESLRNHKFRHSFIYDFAFLQALLEFVGFSQVTRRSFSEGANPDLVLDTPSRAAESLYAEAIA